MSTNNFVQDLEYNDAKGVDTTSPENLIAPGYASDAQNANVGVTGGWIKRDGFTSQLTTAWAGTSNNMSIRNGIEYIRSDSATPQLLLYGTDDSGDGRLGRENVGLGVDDIVTGLSSTDRLAFVQFEDRLMGFNGDSTNSPFVFEGGATTRTMGIAGPITDPTPVDAIL
jgi:hypothetical protein